MAEKDASPGHVWADFLMMTNFGGKERTLKQWQALLNSVGLKLTASYNTGQQSLLVAEKAVTEQNGSPQSLSFGH